MLGALLFSFMGVFVKKERNLKRDRNEQLAQLPGDCLIKAVVGGHPVYVNGRTTRWSLYDGSLQDTSPTHTPSWW
jgi:hypothetical protein